MSEKIPLDIAVALSNLSDPNARDVLLKSSILLSKQNWDDVYTTSIREAMNEKYVGKPVKIHASISFISNPIPFEVDQLDRRITIYRIRLSDLTNDALNCTIIPYSKLGDKIHRLFNQGIYCIFKGTILSVIDKLKPIPSRYYIFYLYDIDEMITTQDVIRIKPDPSQRIGKIFQEHASKNKGILNFIKSALVDNLGIMGLEKAKHLNKCVDFMIYQSFSHGMDKYNPMKLHSLIIGGPGEGKKLLSLIAKTLNPVYEEATPAKTTVAGLVGASKSDGNGWVSTPGLIPQASGGVLSIQDYHEVKKDRQRINEAFAGVMADGIALDSTAAKTKHEAVTSIHLDINRQSQINTSKTFDNYSDINLPLNLISRFDFIMDIPTNLEEKISIAQDILSHSNIIDVNRPIRDIPQWQRDLQVIIAYIRTYFHLTEIPKEVNLYAQQKLNDLIKEYEFLTNEQLYSGMMTRLAVSINKYALAISSANLRIRVKTEDIDKAFDFISEKIKFLSSFAQDGSQVDPDINLSDMKARQKLIYERFHGKVVSIKEITEYLTGQTEKSVGEKTIRRDLKQMGSENPSHGKWKIH